MAPEAHGTQVLLDPHSRSEIKVVLVSAWAYYSSSEIFLTISTSVLGRSMKLHFRLGRNNLLTLSRESVRSAIFKYKTTFKLGFWRSGRRPRPAMTTRRKKAGSTPTYFIVWSLPVAPSFRPETICRIYWLSRSRLFPNHNFLIDANCDPGFVYHLAIYNNFGFGNNFCEISCVTKNHC